MPKQKIEIKLVKSPIGYNVKKKNTLKALGLTKMNKIVVKNKDNAILGMIKQVFNLVEVKELSSWVLNLSQQKDL